MRRVPVTSSRMVSVGWENDILEIEFPNGKIYHYIDVTHDKYLWFMSSPSLGAALKAFEIPGKYYPIN